MEQPSSYPGLQPAPGSLGACFPETSFRRVSAGASAGRVGADITVAAGSAPYGAGGDVAILAGTGNEAGRVSLHAGASDIDMADDSVSIKAGVNHGIISLSVPMSTSDTSLIGLGLSTKNKANNIDFRVQSFESADGKDSSMVIATAPLQVAKVQFSADERIMTNIQSVDKNSILQKFKLVQVRSYRYTDAWLNVKSEASTDSVRGVVAQELEKVFPEYVSEIRQYELKADPFQRPLLKRT